MTQLEQVHQNYLHSLIDIKYKYAVDLLKLLSDDDYSLLCDDNQDLMGPISSPDGEEYLHREDVLDKLISTFIKYIEDAEPDPGKMNMSELKQYTAACMEQLDEDTLRNVAYNLKNTLKYSSNA